MEERTCPNCGRPLPEGRTWCPHCGSGQSSRTEPPVYLLGSSALDSLLGVALGALPMILGFCGFCLGGASTPVVVAAGVAFAALLIAFFTGLRPFRTLRQAVAVIVAFYLLPIAVVFGLMTLCVIGKPEMLWMLLTGIGAFALAVLLLVTAFRRR